jgi:hypothetical protein
MTKPKEGVTRRQTLQLASALSALGVGLGVALESSEAEAAEVAASSVGQLSVKLYKEAKSGDAQLVQTFDLGALSNKAAKDIAGQYTVKIYNLKIDGAQKLEKVVSEQTLTLTTIK